MSETPTSAVKEYRNNALNSCGDKVPDWFVADWFTPDCFVSRGSSTYRLRTITARGPSLVLVVESE